MDSCQHILARPDNFSGSNLTLVTVPEAFRKTWAGLEESKHHLSYHLPQVSLMPPGNVRLLLSSKKKETFCWPGVFSEPGDWSSYFQTSPLRVSGSQSFLTCAKESCCGLSCTYVCHCASLNIKLQARFLVICHLALNDEGLCKPCHESILDFTTCCEFIVGWPESAICFFQGL